MSGFVYTIYPSLLQCFQLARALSAKFDAAFEAVNKISETLQEEYKQGYFNDTTSLSCCQVNEHQMEYNFLFKKNVGATLSMSFNLIR